MITELFFDALDDKGDRHEMAAFNMPDDILHLFKTWAVHTKGQISFGQFSKIEPFQFGVTSENTNTIRALKMCFHEEHVIVVSAGVAGVRHPKMLLRVVGVKQALDGTGFDLSLIDLVDDNGRIPSAAFRIGPVVD